MLGLKSQHISKKLQSKMHWSSVDIVGSTILFFNVSAQYIFPLKSPIEMSGVLLNLLLIICNNPVYCRTQDFVELKAKLHQKTKEKSIMLFKS